MKTFLDTSALIDLLENEPSARNEIDRLGNEATFHTSAINLFELLRGLSGIEAERKKGALNALLANIEIIDIDSEIATEAARIYAELKAKGKPVNEADYIIAASCATNGIRLIVTQNKKHFQNMHCFDKVITY